MAFAAPCFLCRGVVEAVGHPCSFLSQYRHLVPCLGRNADIGRLRAATPPLRLRDRRSQPSVTPNPGATPGEDNTALPTYLPTIQPTFYQPARLTCEYSAVYDSAVHSEAETTYMLIHRRPHEMAPGQKLYPRATVKKIVKSHSNRNLTKNVDVNVRSLRMTAYLRLTWYLIDIPQLRTLHANVSSTRLNPREGTLLTFL